MHIQTIQSHLKKHTVLRIKTPTGYKKHCVILKQKFIERECGEKILKGQIDQIDNIDQGDLLLKRKKVFKIEYIV